MEMEKERKGELREGKERRRGSGMQTGKGGGSPTWRPLRGYLITVVRLNSILGDESSIVLVRSDSSKVSSYLSVSGVSQNFLDTLKALYNHTL